jgi:hypothetical protein
VKLRLPTSVQLSYFSLPALCEQDIHNTVPYAVGLDFCFFPPVQRGESIWHVGHSLAYWTSYGWWMMMCVKQSMELLARETEILEENLPQSHFVHKSHMTWHKLEPGPPQLESSV